ncbi:MAG: hypothetical protein JW958_12975 [Candidatus Eisenbacteria bacterium]|nr:hypothetical protein [Candidatus Eisenbacteria bacterium]
MSGRELGIGIPKGMSIRHDGARLVIVRSWFSPSLLFLTAFVIVWDGFLVFWYRHALTTDATAMKWFPLLHVAVGVGLTYRVIAGWLNRTFVKVGGGEIVVRHAPIPWLGNKTLKSSEIAQLYSKEKVYSHRQGKPVVYEVRAITRADRNRKLVGGLETSEQAICIEQQIEKALGIKARRVPGELGDSAG